MHHGSGPEPQRVEVVDGAVSLDGRKLALPEGLFVERELLPRGANGYVFLALDRFLQRKVVVKVWVPKAADWRDKIAQGVAEARKIASLRHPNIAEVFSAGQPTPNLFFLTMEYLEGPTLTQWLSAAGVDFYDRYRVWSGIYAALVFAHRQGVYHGDIHGGNVIVVGTSPKVIDFGTSLFAGDRSRSQSRESRLIVELVGAIFPEHRVSDLAIGDWRDLRPEAALVACGAWSDLLWIESDLTRQRELGKELDDYDLRAAAYRVAGFLRRAPLFAPKHVTDWFRGVVREEWCVLTLLDSLKDVFADVFDPQTPRVFHVDLRENADQKLAALGPLAARAQKRFIASGPWE
jgi:tRNA A-37 threonylcarbamoyl transferase component Bud32